MVRWSWILLAVVAASACGDDDDGGYDGGDRIDAATVAGDASGPDAPPVPDAAGIPDAAISDAAPADADPGGSCGIIGAACSDVGDCGAGYECVMSIGGRFCSKQRPGCGGFAGDTCDDPAAPLCHYLPSADIGPCLSEFERDCICTRSPGSILDCP